jgi:transposase
MLKNYLRVIFIAVALTAFPCLPLEASSGIALALPLVGVALLDEDRMSLNEAARRLGVAPSTVWRWALRGVRGVKLETQVWGGKRYVTESSLERFREDCTAAANGEQPHARTPHRRQRDIEAADRELKVDGF